MKYGDKYVCGIRGLLVTNKANFHLVATQVEEYVEAIPKLTETIKESWRENNLQAFEAALNEVLLMLEKVYSKYLMKEIRTILTFLRLGNRVLCEKKMYSLIPQLLSLSIEMQMAKNRVAKKSDENDERDYSVEYFTDVLNNLSVVKNFMEQSDFGNAIDIITSMSVFDNDDTAHMLVKAMRSKVRSPELITELINKISRKIESLLETQSDSNLKILLVDDRPEILSVLTGFLKDKYKVYALTCGRRALEFIEKRNDINLFILDIDMPGMDGIRLTRSIRNIPEHAKTPVIILTGNAKKEYVFNAMTAGASDFLAKPPNKEIILAKVFTQLSKHGKKLE